MNFKEQILNLVKLQNIDLESTSIKSMLSGVFEKFDALDVGLKEFERNIEEKESMISELKKQYRSHESDVQMNLSIIKKNEEKLKFIKTNKEYQSLLKAIDDLNEKNSNKEDEMIECLVRIEEAENEIVTKRDEYKQISDDIKNEKEIIKQKSNDGNKKLSRLEKDWSNISKVIESELLKKFIKVKEKAGGVAIAAVNDATCQGCNMNIPPQMYNELQRFDSLKICPHCQRIIFCKET